MTTNEVTIKKYVADEGYVFDWADPHYHTEEVDGEEVEIQDHLYAKIIYLNPTVDNINNYVEIPEEGD